MRRPELSGDFAKVMGWADQADRSACAPTPTRRARRSGARVRRGRHRPVPHRAHVLRGEPHSRHARDDLRRRRGRAAPGARQDPSDAARRLRGLFEIMAGLPVTVRLLDPPLHEFLPHEARKRPPSPRSSAYRWRSCNRACTSCMSSTRCLAFAAAGLPSAIRRSPRCKRGRSSRRRQRREQDRHTGRAGGDDPARCLSRRVRPPARRHRSRRRRR